MSTAVIEGEIVQTTGAGIVPAVGNYINKEVLENTRRRMGQVDIKESTVRDYLYRAPKFEAFLKDLVWNKDSEGLESPLMAYKRKLENDSSIKVTTKNKFFISAKLYCQLLRKEIERTYNISLSDLTTDAAGRPVKGFAQRIEHRKDGVSLDGMQEVVEYLQGLDNSYKSDRLRAMFALLIFQGVRQVEITRLDVEDLNLKDGKVMLHRKGRDEKNREYLRPQTIEALTDYLESSGKKSGPLFTNEATNGNNERLTTRSIRKIVGQVLKEAGVDGSVHGFRHWYATILLLEHPGELDTVAELTGHSNLNMLKVYNDELNSKKAFDKTADVFEHIKIKAAENDCEKVEKMIRENRFL